MDSGESCASTSTADKPLSLAVTHVHSAHALPQPHRGADSTEKGMVQDTSMSWTRCTTMLDAMYLLCKQHHASDVCVVVGGHLQAAAVLVCICHDGSVDGSVWRNDKASLWLP